MPGRGPTVATPAEVLADAAVDGFAEQVRVPGVPAVLLDEVADQPPQAGMVALTVVGIDELVEAALGERLVEPGARSLDAAVVPP